MFIKQQGFLYLVLRKAKKMLPSYIVGHGLYEVACLFAQTFRQGRSLKA